MISSQQILPIRFYDNLFDQDRFNKFRSQDVYSLLNYSGNELPNFQVKRNRSLNAPSKFFLRNVCNDIKLNYYKIIPENIFANDDSFRNYFGNLPQVGVLQISPAAGVILDIAKIECEKLATYNYGSNYEYGHPHEWPKFSFSVIPGRYNLKITVDRFFISPGSSVIAKIHDGDNTGAVIGAFDSAGVFIFNTNVVNNAITIEFENFVLNEDQFTISELQAEIYPLDANQYTDDYDLDYTNLKTFESDDYGYITYCGGDFNIKPGDYYYIIECGNEMYFSEVFSIKSLKELQDFYKITWWNECDLDNQIIYDSSLLQCVFKNVLYIDAALFKPEYETTIESTTDGENTIIPTFKKWQKSLTLEIVKANEFLADALSGIFLHDNVYIKDPLNKNQLVQSSEYKILNTVSDIEPSLSDSFQKVNLKFFLAEFVAKANCCDEFETFNCDSVYTYKASTDDNVADYYIIQNSPPNASDGLFRYIDDTRVNVKPNEYVYFIDQTKFFRYVFSGGVWSINYAAPIILNISDFSTYWEINMNVVPGLSAKVMYSVNGGSYITDGFIRAKEDGTADYKFNKFKVDGATDVKFKFEMRTGSGCSYGDSNIYDQV